MGRATWVLAAVLALCSCSGGPDGPLFDSGWVLTDVIEQGQRAELSSAWSKRWMFVRSGGCEPYDCGDGPHLLANDFCNSMTYEIEIGDDRVTLGKLVEMEFGGVCFDPLNVRLRKFLDQPSFTFVTDGDSMRATSADDTIQLVFSRSPIRKS